MTATQILTIVITRLSLCMCVSMSVCIILRKRILPDSYNSEKITYMDSNIFSRMLQDLFFYFLTLTFIFEVIFCKYIINDERYGKNYYCH